MGLRRSELGFDHLPCWLIGIIAVVSFFVVGCSSFV